MSIITCIEEPESSDPAKQIAVVQQKNASLWKVWDKVMANRKPRAHVNDPSDDIFQQDHEQETWNCNQSAVHEFIASERVRISLSME